MLAEQSHFRLPQFTPPRPLLTHQNNTLAGARLLFPLSIPRSYYHYSHYYFLPFPIIVMNNFPASGLFFFPNTFLFSVQLVPLRWQYLIYFTSFRIWSRFLPSPHHFSIKQKGFFFFPSFHTLLFLVVSFFSHSQQQSSIDPSWHLLKSWLFRTAHSGHTHQLFLKPHFLHLFIAG